MFFSVENGIGESLSNFSQNCIHSLLLSLKKAREPSILNTAMIKIVEQTRLGNQFRSTTFKWLIS